MLRPSLLLLCLLGLPCLASKTPNPPPSLFLGVLRLSEHLYPETAWSKKEEASVTAHFLRLQAGAKEGRVYFAGRTLESNEKTFGLVAFEAASLAEAEAFMREDPAVLAGVMSFTVHPYALAIERQARSAEPSRP